MASRISAPRFPRLDPAALRPDLAGYRRSLALRRPAQREERARLIWRAIFLPWWLWSDLPSLQLPRRDAPLPPGGPAGDSVAKMLGMVARRAWLQRALTILARSVWLVVLVAVIWLAAELRGGPEIEASAFSWIAAAIGIPGVILALLSRPTREQTARMLDRSFGLQERVVTALANIGADLPASGQPAGMRYLQVADAANALGLVRRDPAFRVMPPVRELVLGIICGLAFASLFFLRGGGGEIPPLETRAVPRFVPAAQRFISPPQEAAPVETLDQQSLSAAEIQQLAEQSNNTRRDLQALGDALADHALTRPAAVAIDRGEYDEAAQSLRDIAGATPQLSEAERASLASDLETAAAAMSEDSQGLAAASEEAAAGLQEGNAAAESGMEQLGDAVEQAGDSITPREALDQAMQQAQQSASSESSGTGQQASGQQGESLFSDSSSGAESESAGESGQEGSQSASGEQQEGAGGESGEESGAGESAEPGSSRTGESNAGNVAQAPPEDVLGGSGDMPYQEPESISNPQAAPGESGESSAGAGAGTDSSDSTGQEGGGAEGGAGSEDLPDPSEAEVSESEEAASSGEAADGGAGSTVVLNRMPEGESIRIQGSGSNSSLGSGAGMTSAGGGSTQEAVGEAGPDSNHVPDEYRPIVEAYFSIEES
jgi:hypothetical protein